MHCACPDGDQFTGRSAPAQTHGGKFFRSSGTRSVQVSPSISLCRWECAGKDQQFNTRPANSAGARDLSPTVQFPHAPRVPSLSLSTPSTTYDHDHRRPYPQHTSGWGLWGNQPFWIQRMTPRPAEMDPQLPQHDSQMPDSTYFELSWSILSSIGLFVTFVGVWTLFISRPSPLTYIPIVVSVSCAIANGACYFAFYTNRAIPNRAAASGFADFFWLVG